MRTPGAVPNLCKADSGLSAMIGILAAISSLAHLVARGPGALGLASVVAMAFSTYKSPKFLS